jgi:hypothetical protein
MNNLCEYCGINQIAENYNSTCEFCIYQCSTCHADTPYEDGVSDSDECGVCDLGSGNTTNTTTNKQGDTQVKNTLYTVVGFDDTTEMYQVVGTTVSDIDPNEMVQLLGKQGDRSDFENVITDFINTEVESMVALAQSKKRASASRMTRAEHKPVVMRMGEWNSLIYALETLRAVDIENEGIYVACPSVRVNNGVNVDTLIGIIKSGLVDAQGVVGNA